MTASLPLVNPFAAPGIARGKARLLAPRADSTHDDLYVDVCGSGSAYRAFQDDFDLGTVIEHGRMVLVVGDTGCGKTALLNRCLHHMDTILGGHFDKVVHLDFVDLIPWAYDPATELKIPERIELVARELFEQLDQEDALHTGSTALLEKALDRSYHFAFHRLNQCLVNGVAVVVHLPTPGEFVDEITAYAYSIRRPRIVYIAETSSLQTIDYDHLRDKAPSDKAPLVMVKLRLINTEEVHRFLEVRRAAAHGTGIFPTLADDCLPILRKCRTIRQLEAICFKAYQTRLDKNDRYTTDDVITQVDVIAAQAAVLTPTTARAEP
ncbi:hypothetical protein ACFQV2_29820 [Actinokineospora soli]|uniref:AAA+ ATPase domain-containing protein n=1 Tax=Actinokineospora soli TaxID=1048753 RepID=A0ABW2TV60_9PSEU